MRKKKTQQSEEEEEFEEEEGEVAGKKAKKKKGKPSAKLASIRGVVPSTYAPAFCFCGAHFLVSILVLLLPRSFIYPSIVIVKVCV
jgi:hypothetical protein